MSQGARTAGRSGAAAEADSGSHLACDVAIIGAGVLGACSAWHLAQRGLRVVVLDREPSVGHGSTSRSTAIIRQRYSHPAAMALALEGLRTWERWDALVPPDPDGRRARLVRAGVLFLLPAREPSTPRLADDMAALGIAVERLDRDALARRFPILRFPDDEAVEGLFEPEGGFVDDPSRATADAARAAQAAGATFMLGTRVTEIMTVWQDGAPCVTGVRTHRGETLAAAAVVNCAGPHSAQVNLLARTPLALSTAPLRQQVIDARAPSLDRLARPLPVVADLLNGFYVRPDAQRFRIGAVWPQDERDFVPDPDAGSDHVEERFVEGKLEALHRRLPDLELEEVNGLVGYYDVTVQDWYPIVDRTDTLGYFVAIGTSGAWFKAGPVIGWMVAEMVSAALSGHDTDRTPLELRLPITGHPLPMKLFSRRRAPVELQYGGGVLG